MSNKVENGEVPEVEFEVQDEPVEKDSMTCAKCCAGCLQCCSPVLADHHPLSDNPSLLQRLHFAFLCPPHGRIGALFFVALVGTLWWGVLWALTEEDALPGGNIFSLVLLFICCWCGGYLVNLLKLPPLLGMLIVGAVLGNAPGIDIAKNIRQSWGSGARQIALSIILIRAGLGLDPKALRRLSFAVLRLAFLPCLAETVADAIAAYLIFGFPWPWGFMLGFVIAAVSPAVVVPSLLSLSERGYGIDKGIPTLVIAAASVDDVLAITGFGVLLGISFSTGNIVWNIFKGPLEAVAGVCYGIIGGLILWYIPQKKSRHLLLFRSTMLMGGGMLAVFGSRMVDWAGAGPLGCLSIAFVAAVRWRSEAPKGAKIPVEEVTAVLWMIFQPMLFGLIGAQVNMSSLKPETVGKGIGVLAIGLVIRMLLSFLAVFGTNLNMKERLFIPLAWLPKATVQAAIGSLALDTARDKDKTDFIPLGEQVLMVAVLAILITAPLGAVFVALGGPRLLKHCPKTISVDVEKPFLEGERVQNVELGDGTESKLLSPTEV